MRPRLALAMSAAVAFATALFVDHRVVVALRAKVAGDAEMAQAERHGRHCFAVRVAVGRTGAFKCLAVGLQREACAVAGSVFLALLFQPVDMQFQRAGYGVGQGAHLLHAEADGTAAADAAQLLGDDLDAIRLRERTEDAQVQRDQAAQRLRQRGDVAASLADVDEDLERPVLIAVDGDVDLALRRADVPRVTMRYLRHRLDALLDGDNWLKHQRLLLWRWLSRLGWLLRLLLLNMREDAYARAVAHIGDAFAAQFVGQAVELLHILDGVAIRRVHRLADAGVGEALDGCLHAHMLFRRQVVGGNEVGGRWLVGMLVAPLLE